MKYHQNARNVINTQRAVSFAYPVKDSTILPVCLRNQIKFYYSKAMCIKNMMGFEGNKALASKEKLKKLKEVKQIPRMVRKS